MIPSWLIYDDVITYVHLITGPEHRVSLTNEFIQLQLQVYVV